MFICFMLISLLNFLRGDETKSIIGINKCSTTYWTLTFATFIISASFCVIIYFILKKEESAKQE